MGDNREQTLERIPMDLASSTPVIKPDQSRNTPGTALLRTVPLSNQQRYLAANIQSAGTVISTSSSQNQIVSKQGNIQRLETVPSTSTTGLHQTAVINRLTTLPIHSNTTSSYHVPRGAAAVANIAVPRSPVATPIIRGSSNLQTIGVTPSSNTGFVSGLRATTPVGRTAIQVAGGTSWLGVTTTTTTTQPARQPTPTLTHTSANTAYQGRNSMTVTTTRLGPGNAPIRLNDSSTRPVLLQAAATHKQISIAQPGTQVHIADKAFLKAGVVPVRPPSATLSYSNTNAAQSRLTVSNVTTQPTLSRLTATPTLQPVVTSQPGLSRITGTTTIPSVVSLHPAVLVPSQPTVPIKATSHQAIGPKVIAQPAHGPAIQIQSVPVSSVAQPTIAITTVVTRPVGFSTTSSVHQTNLSMRTTVSSSGQPSSGVTKVYTQAAAAEPSVFIQTHKTTQGAVTGNVVSIANNLYSLPTTGFSYEPSGFQVTGVQRTFSTASVTTTTAPQTYSTSIQARTSSNQVHGIVNTGQQIKYNPVMVVDHNRSNIHSYVPSESPSLVQTSDNTNSTSGQTQNPPTVKQNASPRPSILRKRDSEGTPLKAQKNLTPLLTSLSVSTPSSPPSPPKRPESRGNGGGQSSGGSTTISATSSPGLGIAEPDSPPIKQEPGIEEERIGPPVEMSPRKKPRKQQLTGNQIQEHKFSDDDMEFISEEKLKKEPKTVTEDGNHIVSKVVTKRPIMSLLNSYRHTWKSKHHHFLRYTDVKAKDERRPTVHDIANQKCVLHKVNGWKVYHLSTQMEDLSDLETEVFQRLTVMLKTLEKKPGKEMDKDVNRVNELIKGNIQRSKIITDQLQEAKSQIMKIFDHKGHVTDIINRCANKRSTKKRDRL